MANPGTLYVFLKGLAVARERGSELEIVLPRVPGHVYRAGSWLAESTIAPRSLLRLRGVRRGTESFARKDFVIHLPDCSVTARGRAATLRLPRAKEIVGFLCSTGPNGGPVATRDDNGMGPERVATVQILIYD